MENVKTQAKHQLDDQDLSNDYKDRSIQQYTFILALFLDPNAHFCELKWGLTRETQRSSSGIYVESPRLRVNVLAIPPGTEHCD